MVVGTVAGIDSASWAPRTAVYAGSEPPTKQVITMTVNNWR